MLKPIRLRASSLKYRRKVIVKANKWSISLLFILLLSSSKTYANAEYNVHESFRLSYPQTVGIIDVSEPFDGFINPATGYLTHQYFIRTEHYHRYPSKESLLCSVVYLNIVKDKIHYGKIAQNYQCEPSMQQNYDEKKFETVLTEFGTKEHLKLLKSKISPVL